MPNEISIRKWVKRGAMLLATDALDHDDPDHPYNQAAAQGVQPEAFGLKHPLYAQFADVPRSELIRRLVQAEKDLAKCMRQLS